MTARRANTIATVLFVGLVVGTFAVMRSVSRGIDRSLAISGDRLNLIIKAPGADSEATSALTAEQLNRLEQLAPYFARYPTGEPVISRESICFGQATRRGDRSGRLQNIAVRGVIFADATAASSGIRIVEGRPFRDGGPREVIVGRSAQQRFENLDLSGQLRLGTRDEDVYEVVGVFEAGNANNAAAAGGMLESEIWGYANYIMASYSRTEFSSARIRLRSDLDDEQIREVIRQIRGPQIGLDARTEPEYFSEMARQGEILKVITAFLGICMGVAAAFAIMNSMYGAVAGRTREIAVLRAIGFSRRMILLGFLVESLILCAIAGALGCMAALLFDGARQDILSGNFTALAFELRVSPDLLIQTMLLAMLVGLIGAFLPALRASRLDTLAALRSVQ